LPAESAFFADATAEERAILRERALGLMPAGESQDRFHLMPLAVVSLNGEYFAVDLNLVREFGTIHHVTPVPCCPPHIVGQMNLRGDILTLVDIRGALRMPMQGADE